MTAESITKKNRDPLPSFKNPPVVEVALSVQFAPLGGLGSPHYGAYRNRVMATYPHFEEKPPLQKSSERFGNEQRPLETEVILSDLPPLRRCWFIAADRNCLVQLDPQHFIYNWRNETGTLTYPRYHSVRQEFERLWAEFLDFVRDEGLSEPKVDHWEVCYVNHIDKGEGWESLSELRNILLISPGVVSEGFLPPPETIQTVLVYGFPEKRGRLHISLQRAIRQRDMQECLLLRLVARGQVSSSKPASILECHDMGREWIVRAFAEITGKHLHVLWGRE